MSDTGYNYADDNTGGDLTISTGDADSMVMGNGTYSINNIDVGDYEGPSRGEREPQYKITRPTPSIFPINLFVNSRVEEFSDKEVKNPEIIVENRETLGGLVIKQRRDKRIDRSTYALKLGMRVTDIFALEKGRSIFLSPEGIRSLASGLNINLKSLNFLRQANGRQDLR